VGGARVSDLASIWVSEVCYSLTHLRCLGEEAPSDASSRDRPMPFNNDTSAITKTCKKPRNGNEDEMRLQQRPCEWG
jgi:hypothetical protein